MSASDIGHNGGPQLARLTHKGRIEVALATFGRGDLTTTQKLVAAILILRASPEWASEVGTQEIQSLASLSRRETVFAATKALSDKGVITRASGRGQIGRYTVLPPSVVAAVIEAYVERKSGTVEPYHPHDMPSGTVEPYQSPQSGTVEPYQSGKVVRLNRTSTGEPYQSPSDGAPDQQVSQSCLASTSTVEPYQSDESGTVEPYQSAKAVRLNRTSAPSRARAHFESSPKITSPRESDPPNPPLRGSAYWSSAIGSTDQDAHAIEVQQDGTVKLLNGEYAQWLERFANDRDRLDLAVMEIHVQPHSLTSPLVQARKQLARIAGSKRDSDRRYAAAAKRNETQRATAAASPEASAAERRKRSRQITAQVEVKLIREKGGEPHPDLVAIAEGRA